MTPIPVANERVQGTPPEGYSGLLQVASRHGPTHLLEGCTVSASTADPPYVANGTVGLVSAVAVARLW